MASVLSSSELRPIAGGFTDSSCWVIQDEGIVYNPQNRSYKEVLLSGAPIEWFFGDDVPVIAGPPVEPIKINLPRTALCDRDSCYGGYEPVYDYIETDAQVINDGTWTYLDRAAIMKLPWMPKGSEDTIHINGNCQNEAQVMGVSLTGAIWLSNSYEPSYIMQNKKKPAQLRLVTHRIDDEGWMTNEIFYTENIETVYVSSFDCSCLYSFDKEGRMSIYNDRNSRWDYDNDRLDYMEYMAWGYW